MDDRENYDARLHDCMLTIWTAYRKGTMKEFNDCFRTLYQRYEQDPGACTFIKYMGLALAGAKNKWDREVKE